MSLSLPSLGGNSLFVRPMSLTAAPAACTRKVGAFAFQPKRPVSACCVSGFHTMLRRPEMPSPFGVVGIFESLERPFVDRLEEAQADHLRRRAYDLSAIGSGVPSAA